MYANSLGAVGSIDPIAWLNSKLAELLNVPARCDRVIARARVVQARPGATLLQRAQCDWLIGECNAIKADQVAVLKKMRMVPRTGLGVIPPVVIIGVIAVSAVTLVATVTALLRRPTGAELAAGLLERGTQLTPEQIKAVSEGQPVGPSIVGELGGALKLAVIGLLALKLVESFFAARR